MNILNPKSWRFGSDDFRFQIGDFQPFNFQGLKTSGFVQHPSFAQPMVKWWFGLVIKASWMDESSLHSISFKKSVTIHVAPSHPNKKKHQEWCFVQLSNMGFVSGFQIWKTPPKNRKQFDDLKRKLRKPNAWVGSIGDIGFPSRSPGPRARFPRFCLHPSKIEWNQIPTEPVQQVARLAVRYSGFLSGSVKRGSVRLRFLGLRVFVGCNLLTILGLFEPPRTRFKASKLGSYTPKSLTWLTCFQWWELQVGNLLFRIAHFQVPWWWKKISIQK